MRVLRFKRKICKDFAELLYLFIYLFFFSHLVFLGEKKANGHSVVASVLLALLLFIFLWRKKKKKKKKGKEKENAIAHTINVQRLASCLFVSFFFPPPFFFPWRFFLEKFFQVITSKVKQLFSPLIYFFFFFFFSPLHDYIPCGLCISLLGFK